MDYLKEYCEVVYLPRTEGISSTQIRNESTIDIRVGIVGTGRIAKRLFLKQNLSMELTYVRYIILQFKRE